MYMATMAKGVFIILWPGLLQSLVYQIEKNRKVSDGFLFNFLFFCTKSKFLLQSVLCSGERAKQRIGNWRKSLVSWEGGKEEGKQMMFTMLLSLLPLLLLLLLLWVPIGVTYMQLKGWNLVRHPVSLFLKEHEILK